MILFFLFFWKGSEKDLSLQCLLLTDQAEVQVSSAKSAPHLNITAGHCAEVKYMSEFLNLGNGEIA